MGVAHAAQSRYLPVEFYWQTKTADIGLIPVLFPMQQSGAATCKLLSHFYALIQFVDCKLKINLPCDVTAGYHQLSYLVAVGVTLKCVVVLWSVIHLLMNHDHDTTLRSFHELLYHLN